MSLFSPAGSEGSCSGREEEDRGEDRDEGRCCLKLIRAGGCRADTSTKYVSDAAAVHNQDKKENQTGRAVIKQGFTLR